MNKYYLLFMVCAVISLCSCTSKNHLNNSPEEVRMTYNVGKVKFEDKALDSKGSNIYHQIIKDPQSYIKEQARTVLATLYDSPKDSIPLV